MTILNLINLLVLRVYCILELYKESAYPELLIRKFRLLISNIKETCFYVSVTIFSIALLPLLILISVSSGKVKGILLKNNLLLYSFALISGLKNLNLLLKIQILFYSFNFSLFILSILIFFQMNLFEFISNSNLTELVYLILLNYTLMELEPSSLILNGDTLTFDPFIFMSSGAGNENSNPLGIFSQAHGNPIYMIEIGPGAEYARWTVTFSIVDPATQFLALKKAILMLANPLATEDPTHAEYNHLNNLALQAEAEPSNSAAYACEIARKTKYTHEGFSLGKDVYLSATEGQKLAISRNPETAMYAYEYDAYEVEDWSPSVKMSKTEDNISNIRAHLTHLRSLNYYINTELEDLRVKNIEEIEKALN